MGREFATSEEGNFHRLKIVFANNLSHGLALCRGVFSLAGQQKVIKPIAVRDELNASKCNRTHTGQVIQIGKELLIEVQQPFVFVTVFLRL